MYLLKSNLKLGRAYETLKDESKRRAYDLIYPSLRRERPSPHSAHTSRPSPATTSQPKTLNEAAQIAALQKLKQERSTRWQVQKSTYDLSIFELKRSIRQLEQEIKNLDDISDAEAALEAQKNSWSTWLLSPIYKKPEDTAEEKERKNRKRQERRIEKDIKERRLVSKQVDMKKAEILLSKAKEEFDAANRSDEEKIRVIQARKQTREIWEKLEKENAERERKAKIWKEQEEQRQKQEREMAEKLRRQREEERRQTAEKLRRRQEEERAAEQAKWDEQRRKLREFFENADKEWEEEERAAEQERQEEELRRTEETRRTEGARFLQEMIASEARKKQERKSTCRHDRWWPKIVGRKACPECHDVWTYLLQCPGCEMKACPKCQAAVRPKKPRHGGRTHPRAPPRVRTPSPDYGYDYYD